MDNWTVVLLAAVGIGLILMFAGSRGQERARVNARLAAIERKLDAVATQLGVTMPAPEQADVVRHLQQGQRIQAVKAYRDSTGAGLAEAKAAVDRIAADHGLGR